MENILLIFNTFFLFAIKQNPTPQLKVFNISESRILFCFSHLNIFEVANINSALKNLREKNFWVYGFDASGKKNFTEVKWKGNNVLLFGSEGFGMRKHTIKYTDFLVRIDINKNVESLNVSNSAAIVFHHINQQKKS